MTSVDKLESLIVWAHDKRELLQGSAARVWVVGAAVRQLLGEGAAGDNPTDEDLGRALASLVTRGWDLSGGEGRFTLSRGTGATEVNVELVAEPQPWLAAGDDAVCEDAGELGRRLQRWTAATGVLPDRTAARSAAAVFDAIQAAKTARRPTPIAAGALPAGVGSAPRFSRHGSSPTRSWTALSSEAEELVLLNSKQKYPTLASAGMITVGSGNLHDSTARRPPRRLASRSGPSVCGGRRCRPRTPSTFRPAFRCPIRRCAQTGRSRFG